MGQGVAPGKVKVRSVPVPVVLAAHEEALGEPVGVTLGLIGVVGEGFGGPCVNVPPEGDPGMVIVCCTWV